MTRLKEFIEDNESGKEAWRTSSQIIRKGAIDMSEREQAKQIIDNLPEYKIGNILLFLKGVQFDDDWKTIYIVKNLYRITWTIQTREKRKR